MKLAFCIYIVASVNALSPDRKNYRVMVQVAKLGNEEYPHDVTLDPVEVTALWMAGDVSQNPSLTRAIILHDFQTGFMAIKDINKGKCYISEIDEKYPTDEEIQKLENGRIVVNRELNYVLTNNTITPPSVKAIGGSKIMNFCHTYKTYLLVATDLVGRLTPYATLACATAQLNVYRG